ncbi:MAG TPA: helix-turn-helix domain-containing protein [Polyangiaceae bacterium]|nr:helix-turn-helix domain-containing protein [Polyangiaceae bacterium]
MGDGETFSEAEVPTGPASTVASKGRGFGLPTPHVVGSSRARPAVVTEIVSAAMRPAFIDGERLEARHLAFPSPAEPRDELQPLPLGGLKLERIERIEREAIAQTLRLTGGNKARAAEILGIASSTLYEKLKRYAQPMTP